MLQFNIESIWIKYLIWLERMSRDSNTVELGMSGINQNVPSAIILQVTAPVILAPENHFQIGLSF